MTWAFRILLVLGWLHSAALAAEPPVPHGPGPTGVAVALIGPGIDYRMPELAHRLARDGEGDLISWDFTDNDTRPFADTGPGTRWAGILASRSPHAVLVIAKQLPSDPLALGHMLQFVIKTPARIIVWPSARPDRPDWPILAEAVHRFTDRLFIIPAYARHGSSAKRTSESADNLLIVDHSSAQRGGRPRIAHVVVTNSGKQPALAAVDAPEASVSVAALCANALARQPNLAPAELRKLIINSTARGLARPTRP